MDRASGSKIRSTARAQLWTMVRLIDEDSYGMISGSPYETARILSAQYRYPRLLSPMLSTLGIAGLLRSQNADGSWGSPHAPAGYHTLPTLAATSALLERAASDPAVRAASCRGLDFLARDSMSFAPTHLPRLLAIEYTVPDLLERLDRTLHSPPWNDSVARQYGGVIDRARMLQRANLDRLNTARERAAHGESLPSELYFALEALPAAPRGWSALAHTHNGAVSGSPALTATAVGWQGVCAADNEAYLRREGIRHQGIWPNAAPATLFERAGALALAARLGLRIPPDYIGTLAGALESALGPRGMPFAPGLPADGECTGLALFALHSFGFAPSSACLLSYRTDTGFARWLGRDVFSVTATAHILEALVTMPGYPVSVGYRAAVDTAIRGLVESQHPDGHWDDTDYASPMYPTAAAAMALTRAESSDRTGTVLLAVADAIDWIVNSQRAEGSWGSWCPTTEETAHAIHTLRRCAQPKIERHVAIALARADAFLLETFDVAASDPLRTPLWHAKDLCSPQRIERLHTLSALL